jgi:adenosylcobinamide kinase/adenosylcobinamide-phosphate guanylyltransferase
MILVTGAARSGKSEWAETLAGQGNRPVTYIATAQVDSSDREWQSRIEQHRRRRPSHWQTLHVPLDLATIIETAVAPQCLLIDSLGTWVANWLDRDELSWQETQTYLLTSLTQAAVDIILVAEETGWGVVPAYPVGRQFRDRLGNLIRQIGAIADTVYLVTGGHALNLSLLGTRLNSDANRTRSL